jgi:hypothetical protein
MLGGKDEGLARVQVHDLWRHSGHSGGEASLMSRTGYEECPDYVLHHNPSDLPGPMHGLAVAVL